MAIYFHKMLHRLTPFNSLLNQGKYLTTKQFKGHDLPNMQSPVIGMVHEELAVNLNRALVCPNRKGILDTSIKNSSAQLFAQENERVMMAANSPSSNDQVTNSGGASNPDGPTEEQLTNVFNTLRDNLPMLFVTTLDYTIYSPKLIFENRIYGKTTVGLYPYVKQVSLFRMWGHFKYAFVKFEILKITMHPEDASIKIRWCVKGISGSRMIFQIWKFKLWKMKEMLEQQQIWIDGFSTMYVGSDGLVFKHIADKVIPDQDREPNVTSDVGGRLDAIPKLALFIGLSSELSPIVFVT